MHRIEIFNDHNDPANLNIPSSHDRHKDHSTYQRFLPDDSYKRQSQSERHADHGKRCIRLLQSLVSGFRRDHEFQLLFVAFDDHLHGLPNFQRFDRVGVIVDVFNQTARKSDHDVTAS